tara:strand:- start:126 stop:539 length:414 start_codon:yes stop_codon:yes gene_type:complete
MKKILYILLILSLNSNAQIYKYNKVFNDSLVFKNFNQGYIDAQRYFIATNDYLLGLISIPTYSVPSAISFLIPPKNRRLVNTHNPNNKYLSINKDYYNGYLYGSRKKKQKRLVQGAFTPILIVGAIFITVISTSSYQ